MKNKLWNLFGIFALLIFVTVEASEKTISQKTKNKNEITLITDEDAHLYNIELAVTPDQQRQGLMFRHKLNKNSGMLFDFGKNQNTSFWMKNTYISLDMIFIRENGRIADIAHRTIPLSEKTIHSREPVRFVLELAGGTAKTINLSIGDKAQHPFIHE